MPGERTCRAPIYVAVRYKRHTSVTLHYERIARMFIPLPEAIRAFLGLSAPVDEHLLAGADEAAIQSLGASQPVLTHFAPLEAVQSPDLVHEVQIGLSRH